MSQITELEILTLCRRELAALVYPATQMIDNAVIAV